MTAQTPTVEEICGKCKAVKQKYEEFAQHPEYHPWGYVRDLRNKQNALQKQFVKATILSAEHGINSMVSSISDCYKKCRKNIPNGE